MSESLSVELCDWLRSNGIDPHDVPVGAVPAIRGGDIVVTVFLRDDAGRAQMSPTSPGDAARTTVTVPMVTRPSPAAAEWLHSNASWWLVWSNQRGMWWRADERGYTSFLHEAGLYSREQADRIVAKATVDGQLVRTRVDPVTGKEHKFLDEVAIPAPAALV